MTKQEIQAQIKELQDKFNILSSELEKCENKAVLSIWKPKESEKYYSIDGDYSVQCYTNDDDFDKYRIETGNCYKTSEEAEFEVQREKYTGLYRKYVKEHSEPMDFTDTKLKKFYAYWDMDIREIEIANHKEYIDSFQIYGSSEEIIRNAIEFIGKDNFMKYILEIKE